MKLRLDPTNFDACPQYNDWVDSQHGQQHGELDILGFRPRPSIVLFRMSPDTYEAAFADFMEQREEDLKQLVYKEFPSPIAHYFYRFENGYENELQRLHLLRDTWESIVDVIHATAVAECRFRNITLATPIKFSDWLSDSVAQRLLNVERILQYAAANGIELSVAKVVPLPVIQSIRELNQSRNGFSHSAAQSEAQARDWIGDCYPDVIDVLDDLRSLADVQVLRYLGQTEASTIRCEVFNGHGLTRTIRNITLSTDQMRDSQRLFQPGQVLAKCDECVFGLRPFVFYREDPSGHVTKLCLFRKTCGAAPDRRIEYEVVGDAVRWEQDRTNFSGEINELRALFGLGPD